MIYSLLIAWQDNDMEQGEFTWCGKAPDATAAERRARGEMSRIEVEQYGHEPAEVDATGMPVIGGRVIELVEGHNMWRPEDSGYIRLDRRQLAAVLAALRCYQETEAVSPAINDIATDCGTLEAMSLEEIDAICEELNR